jgi:lysophospholipase L1-like esterase
MRTTRRYAYAALLAASLLTVPLHAAEWINTWAASPLPNAATPGPGPAPLSLNNQTVRQVLHLSAGGQQLRIRLSNEYGTKPLRIGAATVSRVKADGSLDASSTRTLRFGGEADALIPIAAPLLSDPVDLPVAALSDISVSVWFPEDTGPCTCHQVGSQDGFISEPGNFTQEVFTAARTIQSRAFVTGVDVQVARGKTIVVLGDSISDGVGSSRNLNRRWPDVLARRLNSTRGGPAWGISNQGISGNRVLEDGAGQSALARFDRDVLAVSGAAYVIVFEGVNDLGISFGAARAKPLNLATAEAMIAGYRQLISRAHARGLKIIGATIAPYEGASYWSAQGEAERQTINNWMLNGKEFDGVLDFAASFADPAQPSRMADSKHIGDHLHGNDAGYEAVGNSIDLKLFR